MTHAVATKKDIAALTQDISFLKEDMTSLKGDISTLKGDITTLKQDLEYRINYIKPEWAVQMEKDIKHHFDVTSENLHYDFRGALKDKISQHEDRIVTLERHVGIKS